VIDTGGRFLVIGGASKAGTTSVFNYLAGHPEICASGAKETRFFLDPDYPLPSRRGGPDYDLGRYLSFFDNDKCRDGTLWKLEATPDYLYSTGTARRLRKLSGELRFIFILREPVSRLKSFFRFGQQMNEIPSSMTFDQYVELQRKHSDIWLAEPFRHPAFAALQHGEYSKYLRPFLDMFGRDRVYIKFYDQLRRDPAEFMMSICRWCEIDQGYFRDQSFEVSNKSVKVRNQRLHRLYFETRQRAGEWLSERQRIHSAVRQVGRAANQAYRKMNVANEDEIEMARSTADCLSSYYEEEPARLEDMLGMEIPWRERRSKAR
jgi:Sulfotransferase domain